MSPFLIESVAETDSTNTQLLQRAQRESCHRRCLLADVQSAGRGQRGRSWLAAPGAALLFSVAWQFDRNCALDGLSLAVGVMTVSALRSLGAQRLALKWPNDVLAPHTGSALQAAPGKLGGILIETVSGAGGGRTAVIGVGINLHDVPPLLATGALAPVRLADVLAAPVERADVLGALLVHFDLGLTRFAQDGFAAFRDDWWQWRAYREQAVSARLPDGTWLDGHITGITPRGGLELASAQGMHTLVSAEVSIRAARS